MAVALRERPFAAVVADMVEGIVVANELDGTEATRARTALWSAVVADPTSPTAPPEPFPGLGHGLSA